MPLITSKLGVLLFVLAALCTCLPADGHTYERNDGRARLDPLESRGSSLQRRGTGKERSGSEAGSGLQRGGVHGGKKPVNKAPKPEAAFHKWKAYDLYECKNEDVSFIEQVFDQVWTAVDFTHSQVEEISHRHAHAKHEENNGAKFDKAYEAFFPVNSAHSVILGLEMMQQHTAKHTNGKLAEGKAKNQLFDIHCDYGRQCMAKAQMDAPVGGARAKLTLCGDFFKAEHDPRLPATKRDAFETQVCERKEHLQKILAAKTPSGAILKALTQFNAFGKEANLEAWSLGRKTTHATRPLASTAAKCKQLNRETNNGVGSARESGPLENTMSWVRLINAMQLTKACPKKITTDFTSDG